MSPNFKGNVDKMCEEVYYKRLTIQEATKRKTTRRRAEDNVADKEKILQYMEKLGKAVTDCLNDSEEVKTMIKLLEEVGLQLNLSFVAMVSGAKPLAFPVSWAGSSKELKFEITPEDREFLQNLGIKYDDKESAPVEEEICEDMSGEDTGEYPNPEEEEEE